MTDMNMTVPAEIRTARLYLRKWQAEDASALLPVLEANAAHFGDWIPAAVSAPAPVAELEARLRGYAARFDADEAWRYAVFSDGRLVGEVSMFPRSAEARVPYRDADRVEIGYWLRADATGRGFATEATAALMGVAVSLERVSCIEIRCDPRNVASAAVPQRLGFVLSNPAPAGAGAVQEEIELSVWIINAEAGVHA